MFHISLLAGKYFIVLKDKLFAAFIYFKGALGSINITKFWNKLKKNTFLTSVLYTVFNTGIETKEYNAD